VRIVHVWSLLVDSVSGTITMLAMAVTSVELERGRRSDARENRDRILTAAAQAFAEQGLGVSLIEIARRAGVGNATVHRNFTKEQLVDELFQDWFARRQAVAEQALADPDPWHGLVSFLEDVLADGTRNRAVGPLFAVRQSWREQFHSLIAKLLVRAQDAGTVRPDLTAQDVILAMLGVARTMTITSACAPGQWRRNLAIVLAGMRAQPGDRLPGLPLSSGDLDGRLCQWGSEVLRNDLD
jgi:AcrR family transcriptional regulator